MKYLGESVTKKVDQNNTSTMYQIYCTYFMFFADGQGVAGYTAYPGNN